MTPGPSGVRGVILGCQGLLRTTDIWLIPQPLYGNELSVQGPPIALTSGKTAGQMAPGMAQPGPFVPSNSGVDSEGAPGSGGVSLHQLRVFHL